MYERMLDKKNKPTEEQVKEHLGAESFERLLSLESYLQSHYDLSKEMRFPYGNIYGWGYKYSHKSSHLCDAFFEDSAFTIMIQIGGKQAHRLEGLSVKGQDLWDNRYPCGEGGGWVHYRVLSDEDLADIQKFISAKKKPSRA